MKKLLFTIVFALVATTSAFPQNISEAQRCQREAEYYQRQADSYKRDADSYLSEAKRYETDASYYIRNEKYDRARDCLKNAANAMDWYQTKLDAAQRNASTAEDYLKRAADALR